MEILLLREEEHKAALLAFVAAGDVKVEDGRDAVGNLAKVGRSRGIVRLGLVHRDDEVRVFISSVEICRASLWRSWRSSGLRWRRRRRTSGVATISIEANLVAVDALSAVEIDVILPTLAGLALPELRLPVIRDTAITANLESIVWRLTFVTLQDMSWGCVTFIRQHANHDSETFSVTRAYACL